MEDFTVSMLTEFLVKHNIKAKFVVVGVWNTIFGYLVFCLLDTIFAYLFTKRYVAYMSAMVLGQILAVTNAFIFHKYITFRSRVKGVAMIGEFFRFNTTYIFTFFLSLILLPFFVEVFHIDPKIAAAMIVPVCAVISYLGHTRFSFKQKKA